MQKIEEFLVRVGCPDRPRRQADAAQPGVLIDVEIASLVGRDLVSLALEHPAFLAENHILAPRLLVRIVYKYDIHAICPSNSAINGMVTIVPN
jgi:hypothetical protein